MSEKFIPPRAVSPYLKSLMDESCENDPIANQFVPSRLELNIGNKKYSEKDFQDDRKHEKAPGVIHRYPFKALFCITWYCMSYCRYCFRKDLLADKKLSKNEIEEGLNYIRITKSLNEIILSGGDPLAVPNNELEYILDELYKISHIKFVRIHTRAFTHNPNRIDNELIVLLKKYRNLNIVWHVNHKREVTDKVIILINKLRENSTIKFFSQSVLLKNVNDSSEILKDLFEFLFENGIVPYYLFHCDPIQGIDHFRVSVSRGIKIYKKLLNQISGLALPQYILELPDGYGKIPVDLGTVVNSSNGVFTFKNYKNELVEYIDKVES